MTVRMFSTAEVDTLRAPSCMLPSFPRAIEKVKELLWRQHNAISGIQ